MLLRGDLLSDRSVALAELAPDPLHRALAAVGARVHALPADGSDLETWARERAPLDGVVYDAQWVFAGGGEPALHAGLDGAWAAVRAVAVGALIPSAGDGARARKIVLVAPSRGAGPLASAAAAALESLARTLSVEWARYGITATAVVPGARTPDDPLVELVCFLLSPAGDYFSGCRFDLG